MNLRELLEQLNTLAKNPENLEKRVHISIWNGLNTEPGVDIGSIYEGFDWGHNRLFLEPVSKLVLKPADDRPKTSFRLKVGGAFKMVSDFHDGKPVAHQNFCTPDNDGTLLGKTLESLQIGDQIFIEVFRKKLSLDNSSITQGDKTQ